MKKKRLIKKKKKEDDKRERKNMPLKSNIRVCKKPDNRCYLQKKEAKKKPKDITTEQNDYTSLIPRKEGQ